MKFFIWDEFLFLVQDSKIVSYCDGNNCSSITSFYPKIEHYTSARQLTPIEEALYVNKISKLKHIAGVAK